MDGQPDQACRATIETGAPVAAARAALGDLALIPEWMTTHGGWRGTPPGAATEGTVFIQQVMLMGIPADVEWTVSSAEDAGVVLSGVGPMGLTFVFDMTVEDAGDGGSRIAIGAELRGDPVKGPMGASIARGLEDGLQESLERLAALLAGGAGGAGAGESGSAVLHVASGRRLDPSTPVIVGAGQLAQREPDATRDPAALAAAALQRAEEDSGSTGLLAQADAVYAVASASWPYRDMAALVGERVGAQPRETVQSARFGGNAGQLLVNEAAQAIADGDATVVLVCGAEAGATLAAVQRAGDGTPAWPEQPAGTRPDRVLGSEREANHRAEGAAGLGAPVYMYALIESAVRAANGATREEHDAAIAQLWAGLSEIGATNEHAWQPQAFTAQQLATVAESNRMVSTPYRKLMCANLQVDLASGLILTSVAAAQAAGVPQERWVFPHAGAAADDEWFVAERGALAASPAIRTIGAAALDHAGVAIDQVDHVDLYSCFPAAVQIAAAELGLPVGDPDRPLSLTGGLTFAGGPGNNYGGHAIATMVQRLRDEPQARGLTTSLGWYLTKHAIGIYSATPPERPFHSLHPVVAPEHTRPVAEEHDGPAVVEAYTVQYGRDGEPEAAIISAITPTGARALVRSRQPDVLADAVAHDILGWTADVSGADTIAFTQRAAAPLPGPPPPSVLVEDRGPVRIITLNRPHRRNAIDLATAQLLERVIDAFEADPAVTVAILTGAEGSFCAGMDLKAAAAGQFPITERRGPLGMTRMPIAKPVIAAVEGHALAGGCELALTADLIVAARDSSFGIPEPKRGLVAAAGGVLRLAQRLPRAVATELALTGAPMSAEKLAGFGLVNRLAEPGHALDVALQLAAEIAVNAPLSLLASKQIIAAAPDWSTEEAFQRQAEVAGAAMASQDAQEGMRAFVEKREPVWQGR
ncbi:crotonase/enoyl-CoA hydratase family protein [Conexibacter woesei]|uniref:type II toxin-antitoxin system Rv0910 family toxin n=1 Tax=Conexibacter woesei TaxID=191495 RepID=UPI0004108DB1|nr:crotonase/enoyl-CoA hydratase family protein [Conexibacter woesei]